jgi:hypothetical protein
MPPVTSGCKVEIDNSWTILSDVAKVRLLLSKCFLLFLLAAGFCRADGKMYSKIDEPPVGLPYQRAIIFHDNGKQTLFLQSMLAPGAGPIESEVAWVVPIPTLPEVAALQADASEFTTDFVFRHLARVSAPKVHKVSSILLPILFLLAFSVLSYFVFEILRFRYGARTGYRRFSPHTESVILYLYFFLMPLVFLLSFSGFGGKPRGFSADRVHVIADGRVGRIDYQVVLPTDPGAMEKWLKENGFGFVEGDRVPIAAYVKAGWHFVTLRLKPEAGQKLAAPDPVILRFDAPKPVYPLALTATIGQPVEVLLHVFSSGPVDASNGMKKRFSGATRSAGMVSNHLLYSLEPEEFFSMSSWEFRLPHLTTFKETLTPERMREDIVFQPARDPTPYRETKWEW